MEAKEIIKGLKNMKAKVTLMTALIGIVIVALFIGGGVLFVAEYMTESVVEAKVLAINTRFDANMQTDGMTGSEVTHLITTDKGVMKIQPVGLMASDQFGLIHEGVTYRFTTRGISFAPYRLLPYIIKADSIN